MASSSAVDVHEVLANLIGDRAILRSGAFHELCRLSWKEDAQVPGRGLAREEAEPLVPRLIEILARPGAPDRHRIAFLLGLLVQAEGAVGLDARLPARLRTMIRSGLPSYLGLLKACRPMEGANKKLAGALVFLLAGLSGDESVILREAAEALGSDSREYLVLSSILGSATRHAARSRAVLAYLGAEACAAAGDDQLQRCMRVLACPRCRGALTFHASEVTCAACGRAYGYRGDILDLVPPGTVDPEEFPEEAVKDYETESRPYFVRVMACDWHRGITPAREQTYLTAHLRPIEGAVLDLACGPGTRTAAIAEIVGPGRVIALDYCAPMLVACQRAVPDALFVRGRASELPIADGVLGGVNCSDALQALPDPERAIAEIGRCLRPGAPFTCFTFRAAEPPYDYFQHRLSAHPRRLFSERQILDYSDRAKMDVEDIGRFEHALFFTARRRGSAGSLAG